MPLNPAPSSLTPPTLQPYSLNPNRNFRRGELMHAFVSYRVSSEGPEGNGLAARIAARIRKLSVVHPSTLNSRP